MNKGVKKLSLSKETLRNLNGEALKTVGGGATIACTTTCTTVTADSCQACSEYSCVRVSCYC